MSARGIEVEVLGDWGSWFHVMLGVLAGIESMHSFLAYAVLFSIFYLYQVTTHLGKDYEHLRHAFVGDFMEFAFGVMVGVLIGGALLG